VSREADARVLEAFENMGIRRMTTPELRARLREAWAARDLLQIANDSELLIERLEKQK
jgi:hypothetical protein